MGDGSFLRHGGDNLGSNRLSNGCKAPLLVNLSEVVMHGADERYSLVRAEAARPTLRSRASVAATGEIVLVAASLRGIERGA
jgi:hypothetical protein